MTQSSEQYKQILRQLQALSNPKNVEGMARFGIRPHNVYGISIPNLRHIAKQVAQRQRLHPAPRGEARAAADDHLLAEELWASGIHEARILASMIDVPQLVTEAQMERWVRDFDSWDVCDQCCGNLFDRTRWAWSKAIEWSKRDEEFVKRAGLALMAGLAVHDKQASDKQFVKFLPALQRASKDERNFVKKAVNWALRQIGKRNLYLNQRAIETARAIQKQDSRAARWIAADALRELESARVRAKLIKSSSSG